jgi:hypothetical protein
LRSRAFHRFRQLTKHALTIHYNDDYGCRP